MPVEEANMFVQTKAEAIQAKATEAKYADNKAAGEKFLAENAKNPFIRSGFDTDVFHAILIRVKIKIFYQENKELTKVCGAGYNNSKKFHNLTNWCLSQKVEI